MSETTLTNYNPDADENKIETTITLGGVRGRITINKSTGQSTFNSINSDGSTGDLLASSDSNAWEPTNSFTYAYNVANRSSPSATDENLTSAEFQDDIFYNGQTTKNEDGKHVSTTSLMHQLNSTRQDELGAAHNYINAEDQEKAQQAAYDNNIPGGKSGENEINLAGEKVAIANPQTNDDTESASGVKAFNADDPTVHYEPPAMADGRQVDGERAILRYPLLAPPDALGYDYIKITAYKYQPPGLEMVNTTGVDYGGGIVEGERFETVILPMQPNITESNSTSWNEDQMNAIEGAMGTMASGLIESLAAAGLGNLGDAGGKIAGTFKNIADQIDAVMTDNEATKAGIIAHFAGQAIGKNIMGRQTGQVINPNMELLFNGPRLRTFNFNFTFTPREEDEAKIIRKIIRAFKRNMAPQRSTSNLFLLSPRVFKLKYIYNNRAKEDDDGDGSQHPYMDTFKTCALTAFNVDYTPGGSYATYRDGGSMTQYKVTMSFNELSPIYADEYKLSPQHMGYG